MQVWGLITVPGDEVDFTWPGAHQKEEVCTEIERLSLAPALKTATAVPESSREPNHTLECQCQNGEKLQQLFLTAFGWGLTIPTLLLAVPRPPILLITSVWASIYTFPHLGHLTPMPYIEFQRILPAQPKCLFTYGVFLGWSLLKFPYHSKCIFNMILCLPCIVIIYTHVSSLLCWELLEGRVSLDIACSMALELGIWKALD